MTRPPWLTSGSAVERFFECLPSVGLPVVHEVPEDGSEPDERATRGKAIHRYLQEVPQVGAEAALKVVPDEWRSTCEKLVLTGLDAQLALAPEVAFAYDCVNDTARELGRAGGDRDVAYETVTADEIPCQLDVVGVSPDGRRGLVIDWKSGFSKRTRAKRNHQLWFGGLCLARAVPTIEEVEVQLVNVEEDREPFIQRASFGAFDLDGYALELRAQHAAGLAVREAAARGILPSEFSIGPWCTYCRSKRFCGAQTSLLRAVVGLDWLEEVVRLVPMPPEVAGDARNRLQAAKKVMALVEKMVMAAARGGPPLPLGRDRDGLYQWFGMLWTPGKEELDGSIARDVLREMYPPSVAEDGTVDDCAAEASEIYVSKKALDEAVRKRVPRGQGAKAVEAVLVEIRRRGGSEKEPKLQPKEFTTRDADYRGERGALPEPKP